MRKRRIVILGLAVGSWLAIACSSGGGGIIDLGDGYDRAVDLRENPGNSREAPGAGFDTPPVGADNPGSQGGGGGGGGGSSCPPCDAKYDCTTNGKKTSISLKTDGNACSAGDGVTFDCSGKVLQGGQPIGTWQASGDSYTVTVMANGQSQTLTCTKSTQTTPTPTGTSTGTSTGTVPTGTATTPPGSKTCTDLAICCAKITNATIKNSCNMTVTGSQGNNATCNAAYPSFAPSCP
jgi:hypothetical protein